MAHTDNTPSGQVEIELLAEDHKYDRLARSTLTNLSAGPGWTIALDSVTAGEPLNLLAIRQRVGESTNIYRLHDQNGTYRANATLQGAHLSNAGAQYRALPWEHDLPFTVGDDERFYFAVTHCDGKARLGAIKIAGYASGRLEVHMLEAEAHLGGKLIAQSSKAGELRVNPSISVILQQEAIVAACGSHRGLTNCSTLLGLGVGPSSRIFWERGSLIRGPE